MFFFVAVIWGNIPCVRADGEKGLAVAIIIDRSGSMAQNDPEGVVIQAAEKAVTLMRNEDQLTVVEFSDRPSVIVSLQQVGGDESRQKIISQISRVEVQGDTDLKGGLESAYSELADAESEKKKFAILLSDGEPDLPFFQDEERKAEYYTGLDTTAGKYASNRWAVHSIALHEEEAGPILSKISRLTGGEYFFVEDAGELTKFFHSIMLVQKYSDTEIPVISYDFEEKTYKEGEEFTVYASLKLGEDSLVPGPHLKIDEFSLSTGSSGREPVKIQLKDDGSRTSGDMEAGDGIFSAVVKCVDVGEMGLSLLSRGTYRGESLNEEVNLGQVTVKPQVKLGETALKYYEKYDRVVIGAVGSAMFIIISVIIFRIKKARNAAKIRGKLKYWPVSERDNTDAKALNISVPEKNEIVISSEENGSADFTLPKKNRHFSFQIKKFYGRYYMVFCLPGSFMVIKGVPQSRHQVFHGDRFEIGGYLFEFYCNEASTANDEISSQVINKYLSGQNIQVN